VTIDRAATLANWVWDNVSPSPVDWERAAQSGEDDSAVIQKYVSYMIPLFSPIGISNIDRHGAFVEWVERAVVAPLLPANNRLIDHLADSFKNGNK
jgi:hypothetical protein